jgi:pyruvate,water dikinase
LARRPLRRLIFGWVLANARRLIRNRENLRFERTRLFGRARLIFVELGDRFYRLGLLAEPRDIFYLEVEEALGLVEGVASTADLKGLVAVRKAEFDHYRTLPPLPNRFETRGIPIQNPPRSQTPFGNNENPKSKIRAEGSLWENPKSIAGLGCSPGLVRGPVRVVTDPKAARLRTGEILVAKRTDPGWILLFPAAAGLLVEYGSLLSHSAIVSRELGLPAVVGLAGLTDWLKDGDWVEFDGSTGLVTQLEPPHS